MRREVVEQVRQASAQKPHWHVDLCAARGFGRAGARRFHRARARAAAARGRNEAAPGEVYGAIAASLTGFSNETPMRHRLGGALVRMHLRAAQ